MKYKTIMNTFLAIFKTQIGESGNGISGGSSVSQNKLLLLILGFIYILKYFKIPSK